MTNDYKSIKTKYSVDKIEYPEISQITTFSIPNSSNPKMKFEIEKKLVGI